DANGSAVPRARAEVGVKSLRGANRVHHAAGVGQHRQRVYRRIPDIVRGQHRAIPDRLLAVNVSGECTTEHERANGYTIHRTLLWGGHASAREPFALSFFFS